MWRKREGRARAPLPRAALSFQLPPRRQSLTTLNVAAMVACPATEATTV